MEQPQAPGTGTRLPDQLGQELARYARTLGAELYGVASAAEYVREFPEKPSPMRFVEDAQSIIIIGLPFEPGTVATVLRPELAGLRSQASDQVSTSNVQPAGAERFFLGEENDILARELSLMGYRIAKRLRHQGWTALHLPPGKQDRRFRTAPPGQSRSVATSISFPTTICRGF